MALTPKQAMFVAEYLVDLNATQAAIRAGYSKRTAGQIGEENLRKPEIAEAIQSAQREREERTHITQDQILREVAAIALSPLGDELIKTTEKLKALELAGKHLAMWTDKQQHLGPNGGAIEQNIKVIFGDGDD